jgi:GTP-binding protein
MVFVDEVGIEVKAGSGGNGAASFRREKYVPRGGPAGGDGGRGGDIILEADSNLSTLLDFRYQHRYFAEPGGHGTGKDMHGKDAVDMVLKVPIGTVATDSVTGVVEADLTKHGQRAIIAHGGRGGRGNTHFASSSQQAPMFAENGEPGEERAYRLELKLLADVGLIGFPNAGKSTLIASISAAKPKIAEYPFTTLVPNLGVVAVDEEKTFVVADIPGLIEGASEGVGLGHQFLRHIERTRVLVHLIDMSGLTGREPLEDYEIINRELASYSERLSKLPQLVALNKIDVANPEDIEAMKELLQEKGATVFEISAATQAGLRPLVYAVSELLDTVAAETPAVEEDEIVRITVENRMKRVNDRRFTINRDDSGTFVVTGPAIERLVAMTNFTNEAAVTRLQRIMEKNKLVASLREHGAKEGDSVRIRDIEFDFIDEDLDHETVVKAGELDELDEL